MPKVSVIIPTYNRALLVCAAIDSVINQTYQDFEIIVIDDGSTDATSTAVAAYRDRAKYLRYPHSGIPASVRNAGLSIAEGEYIAFLDSDDLWLPDKLERQVQILNNHLEIGLICSNALIKYHGREELNQLYLHPAQGFSGSVASKLLERNFIITSTTIIRRAILELTGPFCQLSELTALEDYDLWLRISTFSKIYFISDALVIYREHPEQSLRYTQQLSHHWQGHLVILNRLQKFIQEQNRLQDIEPNLVSKYALRYKKNLVKALWKEHKQFQAIRVGLGALIIHPKQILSWVFKRVNTLE